MDPSVKAAYQRGRQKVRRALSSSEVANRWVLPSLRRLERVWPLSRLVSVGGPGVVAYKDLHLRYRVEDAAVAGHLQRTGEYEHETTRVIESLLDRGKGFVDAGAHIGYYTLIGAKIVGEDGHVWAFEPVPGTNAVLQENVELNGFTSRVTVEPFAIADETKTLGFVIDEHSSVSSRMVSATEVGVPLQATSLDDYFASRGWPAVHLVKLDIEGAELDGLRGMRGLAERNPDLALIIEVHFEVLARQGITLAQLVEEQAAMGFVRFEVLRPDGVERSGVFQAGVTEVAIPDGLAAIEQLPVGTVFNLLARKS